MPDAHGNFKGMSVPAAAWERVFGKCSHCELLELAGPYFTPGEHDEGMPPEPRQEVDQQVELSPVSYAERIRTTSSPPEALLVIAEGIDAVLAALAEPKTDDGWGGWAQPASVAEIEAAAVQIKPEVDAMRDKAIAATEAALAIETDPEQRVAMEARLRLLKDDGQAIDTNVPAGVLADTVEAGDLVVTHLPTPSSQRQLARREWASSLKMWEFSQLPEHEFLDAFALGGPLWLYHSGRDEVMAMPVEWRVDFVQDIHDDSPRTAQEVARDILKDASADGTRSASESMLTGDE